MSLRVEDAMSVSGLQRPELVLACAVLVRKGLAKSPVDAIEKLADGSITSDMLKETEINFSDEIVQEK